MQPFPRRRFLGGAVALGACGCGARSPTGDGLFVRSMLDADEVRLVVDTGSTHSVLRTPDGAGTRGVRRRLQVGRLVIEDFELTLAPVGPPSAGGVLGRSFFEGRRVLLDLPGRRLRIGGVEGAGIAGARP
jgi:hypothetical protein